MNEKINIKYLSLILSSTKPKTYIEPIKIRPKLYTHKTLSLLQRATLAEKEVTTLKEQLATTSPTPLQATVPKTNGSLEPSRDQATETRIDRFSPDIKEEKRRSPETDDVEDKMEMAATVRSNSNSSRSSPVVNQGGNLENELAAKEKEVRFFLALIKLGNIVDSDKKLLIVVKDANAN